MDSTLKKSATPRELVMIIVATIALFMIFIRMVYKPNAQKMADLSTQMESVLAEQKSLSQQVELLTQQKQKKQESEPPVVGNSKIQILNGALKPDISETPELIKTLSDPAFVNGLVIDSISYKPEKPSGAHKEIPITIRAHGTFNKLNGFLKNLDELNVLFSVDSVTITTDSIVQGEMSVDMSATFYLIEGIHAEQHS
ncbi:type 4a pilus biogenesis protein PilO [bacterium]|nr:type 4a pilus biogenesis protein PilO [bacterium]